MRFRILSYLSGLGSSFVLFSGSFANARDWFDGNCPDIPNSRWEIAYIGQDQSEPSPLFVDDYWVIPVKGDLRRIDETKTFKNLLKNYIPSNNPRFTCRVGDMNTNYIVEMDSCTFSGGRFKGGLSGRITEENLRILDKSGAIWVVTARYIDVSRPNYNEGNIASCKNKLLTRYSMYYIAGSPTLMIIKSLLPLRITKSSPKPKF